LCQFLLLHPYPASYSGESKQVPNKYDQAYYTHPLQLRQPQPFCRSDPLVSTRRQGGENVCMSLLQLGYLGSLARSWMALRMERREQCHFLGLWPRLTFLNYQHGQMNQAFLVP